MADDQTQRPYRSNPIPARNAPGAAPAIGGSGNDPLAELARLIGQNDPFAEYGRQNVAQRPAPPVQPPPAPQPPSAAPQWSAQAPASYAPPVSPAPTPEMHPAEYAPPAYGAHGYVEEAADYDQHGYDPSAAHTQAEQHDYYDDVPPRRRMGIMAIATVFALAVVGTAGAFGYRALFGSSGSSGPPPVIKADTTPSKIVPAKDKDAKNGKLIYDRVADKGQGQKLVSREEQPLDISQQAGGRGHAARRDWHAVRFDPAGARQRRGRRRAQEGSHHCDPAGRYRHGRRRAGPHRPITRAGHRAAPPNAADAFGAAGATGATCCRAATAATGAAASICACRAAGTASCSAGASRRAAAQRAAVAEPGCDGAGAEGGAPGADGGGGAAGADRAGGTHRRGKCGGQRRLCRAARLAA